MKAVQFPAKKIAVLALFTALGLIVFIIENQFPPLFVPGAKMGLANIFSLAALILYGPAEAFTVLVVRTVLGSLFAGNISMLMYSLSGGAVSLAVSSLLMYLVYPRVSVMAVSVGAAVIHNIVQYAVYVLVSSTPGFFAFLPYAALIGVLSGGIVGAVVMLIFKKVPSGVFIKAAFDQAQIKHAEQEMHESTQGLPQGDDTPQSAENIVHTVNPDDIEGDGADRP